MLQIKSITYQNRYLCLQKNPTIMSTIFFLYRKYILRLRLMEIQLYESYQNLQRRFCCFCTTTFFQNRVYHLNARIYQFFHFRLQCYLLIFSPELFIQTKLYNAWCGQGFFSSPSPPFLSPQKADFWNKYISNFQI